MSLDNINMQALLNDFNKEYELMPLLHHGWALKTGGI